MNDIQEKLKEIGVEVIDKTTGEFRSFEEVMGNISKAFKDLMEKNKTETDDNIVKQREDTIDNICFDLAGGIGIRDKTKNKNELKTLLFKL